MAPHCKTAQRVRPRRGPSPPHHQDASSAKSVSSLLAAILCPKRQEPIASFLEPSQALRDHLKPSTAERLHCAQLAPFWRPPGGEELQAVADALALGSDPWAFAFRAADGSAEAQLFDAVFRELVSRGADELGGFQAGGSAPAPGLVRGVETVASRGVVSASRSKCTASEDRPSPQFGHEADSPARSNADSRKLSVSPLAAARSLNLDVEDSPIASAGSAGRKATSSGLAREVPAKASPPTQSKPKDQAKPPEKLKEKSKPPEKPKEKAKPPEKPKEGPKLLATPKPAAPTDTATVPGPSSDEPLSSAGEGKGKGPVKGKGKGPGLPPPPPKASVAKKPQGASQNSWYAGRRLHWRELPNASDARSIFDLDEATQGKDFAAKFDWKEWHDLFDVKSEAATSSRKRSESKVETTVLSNRQATNAGVVLQKLGDVSGVCTTLLSLDPLPEEEADRLQELIEMVSGAQEQFIGLAEKLKAGDVTPHLRNLERQLLPLVHVDRAKARLRLSRIGAAAQVHADSLKLEAGIITEAACQACGSQALKDLVRAAVNLRHYVQLGPEALRSNGKPRQIMDVSSLISGLREFKAVRPDAKGVNLLLFFAHSLLRTSQDFDVELERDLSMLPVASRSSWTGLWETVAHLQSDKEFIEAELKNSAGAYGEPGSQERTRLASLGSLASDAALSSKEVMTSTTAALDELCTYFGLKCQAKNKKDHPGLTLLTQLAEMMRGFRLACDEVRQERHDGPAEVSFGEPAASVASSRSVSPAPSQR
mmetsp:Transcript_77555/g.136841  ORF Transcript_77555/g.136841 Transcript_77555/m.136841 type:complete len:768 (+) Transcript_77555:64-2367(+)